MPIRYNGNTFSFPERPESSGDGLDEVDSAPNEAADNDYILVQTTEPLTDGQTSKLEEEYKLQLQQYLSDNTWLCRYEPQDLSILRRQPIVKDAILFPVDEKIQPGLKPSPSSNQSPTGAVEVDIKIHQDAKKSIDEVARQVAQIAAVQQEDMAIRQNGTMVRVTVEQSKLKAIAQIDSIAAIEEVYELELHNNIARGVLNANIKINDTEYKGKHQVVTVADTGFDKGDPVSPHPAFAKRVKKLIPIGRVDATDDEDSHGTHVCGSVLGDGFSQHMGGETEGTAGPIQGTAPEAELIVQALLGYNARAGKNILFGESQKSLGDLLKGAYDEQSFIHTNSWGPKWQDGQTMQNPYNSAAGQLDEFVWDHQDMAVCFSAGNNGGRTTEKGHIGAQAAAKNCVTVGSCVNRRPAADNEFTKYDASSRLIGNPNDVSKFSSLGPTWEDRIKPDVLAPGAMILSAKSSRVVQINSRFGLSTDSEWMFDSGTSMATPLVAGCIAVLRQILEDNNKKKPNASLLKAMLINGAVDLGKKRAEQGFGRVDLANSYIVPGSITNKDFWEAEIARPDTLSLDKEIVLQRYAPQGNSPVNLKITLVYMDQVGSELQNNLNLIVWYAGKERHGNKGEDLTFDTVNNVEQVVWTGLERSATVKVQVSQREVMKARKVPFSVVWSVTV